MATGNFENWTGNILDIGPLYPFVGSEVILWIVGMAVWIIWHIWQARHESNEYREEMEKYAKGENLMKAIRGERIL
jgi:hypothetical protein